MPTSVQTPNDHSALLGDFDRANADLLEACRAIDGFHTILEEAVQTADSIDICCVVGSLNIALKLAASAQSNIASQLVGALRRHQSN
jgi:hypothetical protein